MAEAGEVARRLEADGLCLGLTRAGVVAEFSIEDFSSFTRFDVLYVPAKRQRDAKVLSDAGNTFAWVS